MRFMLRNAILITLVCICTKVFSQSGIISTYAGNGLAGYTGDGGAATSAKINHPGQITMDGAGNIYFADISNNVIRKITSTGIISTVAGTGVAGYSGDGGLATSAQLNTPYAVCLDAAGNMYIADEANQRIRKVNTSGIISTIAGTGTAGYSGDGGPATAAMLYHPSFMYVDGPGNIYSCDNQNHRIRKITAATGIITTIAGNGVGGYSGDGGPATSAQLLFPNGMFVDAVGNVYIGDALNNRIRKVNTSGIISTIAGTGTAGYSGDGGLATSAMINVPQGIYIDALGNIFFADTYNHRVRKINAAGIISTVAGIGTAGYSGDGGLATSAQLNRPDGVTVDPSGKIYIADAFNNRIRVMNTPDNAPVFTSGASASLSLCQNSTATSINSLLAVTDLDAGQTLTWTVLTAPAHGTAAAAYTTASTGSTVTPTGLSYTPTAGYSGSDLFTVIVNDGIAADTITIVVTIAPLPDAGTITGSAGICVGSSATLSDASAGGTWSSGNISVATITSSGVTTGVTAGTAAITYAATNSCGTTYATKTVTINPLPSVSPISGNLNLCVGSTSSLTDATPSGTWSSANPSVVSIGSSGLVAPATTGTATISYVVINAFGCTSAAVAVATVNALPAGTVTPSGSIHMCPAGSATLSVTSGIGDTYQWSMGATPIPGATSSNYTTSTGGSYNVTVTNIIGCSTILTGASVSVSAAFTVVPLVSVTATPGTVLCPGGSLASFTATPTNGGSSPTYQWYVNSTPMAAGTSYSYAPSNGDTVKCRLTSSNTCALPTTATNYVVMTVYAPVTPAVSIAAAPNDTVCSGGGVSYLPTLTYGGTSPTYLWLRNGVNVATGPTYYNSSPVDGDVIICKIISNHACVTSSAATSAPLITHVLPNATNTLSVTASATNISSGNSVTFTAVSPYATSFQWYINGTPVPGATNAIFVTNLLANGNIVNCAAHSDRLCMLPATIIGGGISMHVTAGVNDFSATSFNVFPNPNKGYITVGGEAQNTVAIEIADILGHVIYRGSAIAVDGKVNHNIELNNDLSNGHYFVRVTSENESTVFQIALDR